MRWRVTPPPSSSTRYLIGGCVPLMITGVTLPALIVNRQRKTNVSAAVSDRFVQFFKADIQRAALRTMGLLVFAFGSFNLFRNWLAQNSDGCAGIRRADH